MTPVPESARNFSGQLGPGWLFEFGPALNLLPLLGVHATEAEGSEGVMAPEKHPGREGQLVRVCPSAVSYLHHLQLSQSLDAPLSKKPPN